MMIRRAAWMLFLLAGLASWMARGAQAAPVASDDAQAILAVVQSQLNAFADDDAITAFDLATTSVRTQFGDADRLLQTIKRQFPPVYRHRDVAFSKPEIIGGHALQLVRLSDADCQVWVAVFVMRQETSGSWRIDGCRLVKTNSVSV